MGKVLAVLLLAASLVAQTPQASASYSGPLGSGCGWFATPAQDLVVSKLPVLGGILELKTNCPPYGTDWLWFGRAGVAWTLPQSPVSDGNTSKFCQLYAWWVPFILQVPIPYVSFQRYYVPNNTALLGYTLHVQQANWWPYGGAGGFPHWETSRGVRLTFGY